MCFSHFFTLPNVSERNEGENIERSLSVTITIETGDTTLDTGYTEVTYVQRKDV